MAWGEMGVTGRGFEAPEGRMFFFLAGSYIHLL